MDSQSLAISQHAAFGQLQTLETWLADTKEAAAQSPDTAAEWGRIQRVTESIRQRLDSADPALIPAQAMNNLHACFANVTNSLSSFQSNRNLGYLQQANNQCNDLLYHAAFIPGVEFKKARKSLLSYMDDYAKAVATHSETLKLETQEGLQQLETLKAKVATLQTQVDAQLAEAQTLAKKHAALFEGTQEEREEAFDTAEEERSGAYKVSETARNESLAEDLARHSKAVKSFLQEEATAGQQLRESIQSQGGALVALLEGFKTQAEELVGLTGTLTRANAYREAAKAENRRAWVWSGVAVTALTALSVVAFKTLWTYTNGTHPVGIDWSGFSIRLYTLFALTGLAFYAGRQGEIHRNAERQNRRLFSDLASVSPFLSDLADEKREAIIEEIARRVFGQPETHVEPMRQSPLLTPEQIGKAMEVLTEAAGKTIKKL